MTQQYVVFFYIILYNNPDRKNFINSNYVLLSTKCRKLNFRLTLHILGGKIGCEYDDEGETNVSS